MNLWNWLLVPVFEQLPTLDVVHAIGIAFVISFLTKATIPTENETTSELVSSLVSTAIITPLVALLLGYIISLFY